MSKNLNNGYNNNYINNANSNYNFSNNGFQGPNIYQFNNNGNQYQQTGVGIRSNNYSNNNLSRDENAVIIYI